MANRLTLIGFRYSVYTRIVRIALLEFGVDADYVEAGPFSPEPDPELSRFTAFGRVPVLRHGAFTLTETVAIAEYLRNLAAGPTLREDDAQIAARMMQVIGIIDAYGYQPMVRDVFSHGYYRPQKGEEFDRGRVMAGLDNSQPVLRTLNMIAQEGLQLDGRNISLADIHLGPMIAYFTMVPEAADLLRRFPALSRWWEGFRQRPSLSATDPFASR